MRRWNALAGAVAFLTASRDTLAADGARLVVFVHASIKQRALQSALQDGLPGIAVTAVGRVGDLERALHDGQDAVLALPAVLAAKGLAPRVQGIRGGAPDEPYVLAGVGGAPDPAKVKTVGALDLLGREGTTDFVHDLLGTSPKVERVTKVEDLLPLLQMEVVDSVLVAARFLAELRSASRLELASTDLAKRVGLPAVATLGPPGDSVAAALTKLPAQTLNYLGVDGWR